MTAHAPMARVPFAPLDNPRLQHLASAKNRQNGSISKSTMSNGKPAITSLTSPIKRPFEPAIFDDFDGENVDPSTLSSPTKKSKSDAPEKPFKPFTFTMSSPAKSMLPPPARRTTPIRANTSSPRAALTAPAGRSPTKRKGAGLLNNKAHRTSAPFSRIDPPSFNGSRSSSSALPFSLDAALSGTFSNSTSSSKTSAGATIAESMPKSWFFDIHADTPEEEASNLMEHSTLTLDLSSDDESEKKLHDERGKENMPPEGYDAATASRTLGVAVTVAEAAQPARVKKTDIVRKKVIEDEMDDGERSPLASLETEPFVPEGLTERHVMVDATPEKPKEESKVAFAAPPMPFTAGSKPASKKSSLSSVVDVTAVSAEGDGKGEIVIWEDSVLPMAEPSTLTPSTQDRAGEGGKVVADENTLPAAEENVVL